MKILFSILTIILMVIALTLQVAVGEEMNYLVITILWLAILSKQLEGFCK